MTAREAQARLTAARRYSGGSAGAILKSRHVAPPAGRISGRGFGGGHRRGSRRGPCLVVAKIWTDDGRRKAAEMMGLTTEVRLDPPRLILIVRFEPETPRLERRKRISSPRARRGVARRARSDPSPVPRPGPTALPNSRAPPDVPLALAQEAADEKTLKRAFRRLALRYHPDIAKDDAGVEKFHQIQEAYRVLSGADLAHVELPRDQEWDTHDWRWAHRYKGAADGVDGEHGERRRMGDEERRARVSDQLRSMAGAPTRRKRRVIKPLSAQPSVAVEFNSGTYDDDGGGDECPSDGCASEWARPARSADVAGDGDEENEFAYNARAVRGYQSDRHSTETAHERLNAQLAGLHRKKVIRARAMGIETEAESGSGVGHKTGREEDPDAESRRRENKAWAARAARFYGGAGLQLEESTPERFLRLAKLAKEWRDQRSQNSFSQALFSSAEEKMSPKELLQSAVEGASLGACA